MVGTSIGTAPKSRIRELMSADCSFVRGTRTFQPNSARDSHHCCLCRDAACLPKVTTNSPSKVFPKLASSVSTPSADFCETIEPAAVTVTAVDGASPCSHSAFCVSARCEAEVVMTIGSGPCATTDQSTSRRASTARWPEPRTIPANAGTDVAGASPGITSNGTTVRPTAVISAEAMSQVMGSPETSRTTS